MSSLSQRKRVHKHFVYVGLVLFSTIFLLTLATSSSSIELIKADSQAIGLEGEKELTKSTLNAGLYTLRSKNHKNQLSQLHQALLVLLVVS